jgi:hypothetical protein
MFGKIIDPNEKKVTAFTRTILPYFGNLKKEDIRRSAVMEYRSKLSEAISKNLSPQPTSKLCASYTVKKGVETRKRLFDLENVLFYNVSKTIFKDLFQNGFYFEECPPKDNDLWDVDFNHKYSYSFEVIRPWEQDKQLFQIPNIYFNSTNRMQHLFDVWESCMKAHAMHFDSTNYDGLLGIDIKILISKNASHLPLHNIQKPLLDGLICSLQPFVPLKNDHKQMNEKATKNYELIKSIYKEHGNREGLIKADKLVHVGPKGGLHWHPADDKLLYCNVDVIRTDTTANGITVFGTVYAVTSFA